MRDRIKSYWLYSMLWHAIRENGRAVIEDRPLHIQCSSSLRPGSVPVLEELQLRFGVVLLAWGQDV